jgi:hypothetical protein
MSVLSSLCMLGASVLGTSWVAIDMWCKRRRTTKQDRPRKIAYEPSEPLVTPIPMAQAWCEKCDGVYDENIFAWDLDGDDWLCGYCLQMPETLAVLGLWRTWALNETADDIVNGWGLGPNQLVYVDFTQEQFANLRGDDMANDRLAARVERRKAELARPDETWDEFRERHQTTMNEHEMYTLYNNKIRRNAELRAKYQMDSTEWKQRLRR